MATRNRTATQGFADRDEHAFEEIHLQHSRRMASLAYRILGDHDLADDAVQLAMIRAWQAADSFDPEREIGPWLLAITRRAAIDIYRRYKRREQVPVTDFALADQLHPAIAGADDLAGRGWLAGEVRAAVAMLPRTSRQVVELAYFYELSHREIADRLSIPIGTVKSRMFRAQKLLASQLSHLAPRAT